MTPRLRPGRLWRTTLSCILCFFLPSTDASPISLADRAATNDNLSQGGAVPDIVSNFQDLSPVLSLLASDSVEDKINNPGAAHWEHMSSVWSVFGLLGAVRSYLKICAGLSGAEAAGVDLCGGGIYTSKRTKGAEAAVSIGPDQRALPRLWWQDDKRRLLGAYSLGQAPWKRPHVIAIGQARCPFEGRRAVIEVVAWLVTGALTVLVSMAPTFILRPETTLDAVYWPLSLGMAALSALLAGCLLPPILNGLNPIGVAALRDIALERFGPTLQALQTSDAVVTSSTKLSSVILWQTPKDEPWKRSGDRWLVRVLALAATLFLVGSYVLTYILLGSVDTWRSYTWLAVQAAVLILRYVLWSIRPRFIVTRDRALLYLVTGSIVHSITADNEEPYSPRSPEPQDGTWPPTLPREAVHFAVSSAYSKLLNAGGTTGRLSLDALDRLSGVAPADILRAKYCDEELVDLLPRRMSGDDIRIVRLPWSFMEELYAAQGLILGSNPWAFGGLYLAAVLYLHPNGMSTFLGLTTVAPVDSHTRAVVRGPTSAFVSDKQARGPPRGTAGITLGGVCISSLVDGQVVISSIAAIVEPEPELAKWHTRFRNNVAACRRAAVANGPHHCEMHVQNMGDGVAGATHIARTESSLREALGFVRVLVEKEKHKDHRVCRDHCTIVAFSL